MVDGVPVNDIILVLSLTYLCIDIGYEWGEFATCVRPVHFWLLVSYILVVQSRLIYIVGSFVQGGLNTGRPADNGDFLLNLRQRGGTLKCLISMMWLLVLPFFTTWTAVGTYWLIDVAQRSPTCLPNGVHFWFLVAWQILSYIWIGIHVGIAVVAWWLERRLQRAEADLQEVEDADVRARWGEVSRLPSYMSLQSLVTSGLTPKEISRLHLGKAPDHVSEECPICLLAIKPGESVRELENCAHQFHRGCIDLWLLRSKDCPLCKRKVLNDS